MSTLHSVPRPSKPVKREREAAPVRQRRESLEELAERVRTERAAMDPVERAERVRTERAAMDPVERAERTREMREEVWGER